MTCKQGSKLQKGWVIPTFILDVPDHSDVLKIGDYEDVDQGHEAE